MSQEKCEYCNSSDLATVKGELICLSCGSVNKSALENKERYISPTFYQERKLRQDRENKEQKNTLKQIRSDIGYIITFLELSDAVKKQAINNTLEMLQKERKVYADFPWNTRTPQWNYNCFIALSVLVAIKNIIGDHDNKNKIFEFFFNRGEEITRNDVVKFFESLTAKYSFTNEYF